MDTTDGAKPVASSITRAILTPLNLCWLHVKLESVIRQSHMRRQRGFGLLVPQIVAHMREKGALGFERVHPFERLLHGGMRGMRPMAQGVQEQHIQSL